MSDLVASYEDAHDAIEPASDADKLPHLVESKGVTPVQVSRPAGIPKSSISEVLSRTRPFKRGLTPSDRYFLRREP